MALKPNRTRWDDPLSRLDPTEFERLVAEHYRREGWTVEHVGAAASGRDSDGGIDLKLRRGYEYTVVQCKRWTAYQVPHNDVHQLVGVMIGEGATGAVFVTSGEFTRAALEAARKHPTLQLVDGVAVRRWVEVADTAPRADAWGEALRSRGRVPRPVARERMPRLAFIVGGFALLALALLLFVPRQATRSGAIATTQAKDATVPPNATRRGASTPIPMPRMSAPSTAATASSVTRQSAQPMPSAQTPERAGRLRPLGKPVANAATQLLRQAGAAPDPARPIDHENARMAAKAIAGVRSAFWIDRENFVVMVDGQSHRTMAMIDAVCVALQPLGDTLAVVVNVQDVTAQRADDATTLSRNCQLAEGESAMFRSKRQLDVLSPELRSQFKQQQGR